LTTGSSLAGRPWRIDSAGIVGRCLNLDYPTTIEGAYTLHPLPL